MLGAVDGAYVAAEAKMTRTRFAGALLIVEGPTDHRFLERFLAAGCVEQLVAHGKGNALDAMTLLAAEGVSGVLAFVDADFDRLEGTLPADPNVIVSDHHDVEMMLLMSQSLSKLLKEYGSEDKLGKLIAGSQAASVLEHIQQQCACLGELRYCNHQQGWKLRFKGMDHLKFIDGRTLTVDMTKALCLVFANTGPTLVKVAEVELELPAQPRAENLADFCNGHDCTHMLAIGLRQCLGSHSKSIACLENVERLLRIGYEEADFAASGVVAAVREWEANNKGFSVLRPLAGEEALSGSQSN